jgi:hypothetical protein
LELLCSRAAVSRGEQLLLSDSSSTVARRTAVNYWCRTDPGPAIVNIYECGPPIAREHTNGHAA